MDETYIVHLTIHYRDDESLVLEISVVWQLPPLASTDLPMTTPGLNLDRVGGAYLV